MRLKWFRKQLKIKQSTASTELPGSYRKFSQFEFNEIDSSSPTVESKFNTGNVYRSKAMAISPSVPSVPTLRSPQNPMASLLSQQIKDTTHTIDSSPALNNTSYIRHNKKVDLTHKTNNHLPQISIDLLKINRSSEQSIDTMKTSGIRKKKGRAPLPQPAFTNSNNDDFMKSGEVISFRESEIEI